MSQKQTAPFPIEMTVMCTGYHSLLQTFIAFGESINDVTIIFQGGWGWGITNCNKRLYIHALQARKDIADGKLQSFILINFPAEFYLRSLQ